MRRRQVLHSFGATLALAGLAGCLGSEDELATEGNDDSPFEVNAESLLMQRSHVEDLLEEGWIEEDPEEVPLIGSPHAVVQYIPLDEESGEFHMESGVVTSGVWLYDDVETAREAFDDHPYQTGHGYDDLPIASEAIGGTVDEHADTQALFRDANAMGGIHYENPNVDVEVREERGLRLAANMHESWRDGT